MVYGKTTKKVTDSAYEDLQNHEFHVLLPSNHYENLNNILLYLPIKISKYIDANQNISGDLLLTG